MPKALHQSIDQYESILQAYKRGELWPMGPCRSTGCSAESPIDLTKFRSDSNKKLLRRIL